MKYKCNACSWVYDEEVGLTEFDIDPDTTFEDLPNDFECPFCGGEKASFSEMEE